MRSINFGLSYSRVDMLYLDAVDDQDVVRRLSLDSNYHWVDKIVMY